MFLSNLNSKTPNSNLTKVAWTKPNELGTNYRTRTWTRKMKNLNTNSTSDFQWNRLKTLASSQLCQNITRFAMTRFPTCLNKEEHKVEICKCWQWVDAGHLEDGWWCWAWVGSHPHWQGGPEILSRNTKVPAAQSCSSGPLLPRTSVWTESTFQ